MRCVPFQGTSLEHANFVTSLPTPAQVSDLRPYFMVQTEFYPGFDPIPASSDATNIASCRLSADPV